MSDIKIVSCLLRCVLQLPLSRKSQHLLEVCDSTRSLDLPLSCWKDRSLTFKHDRLSEYLICAWKTLHSQRILKVCEYENEPLCKKSVVSLCSALPVAPTM